MSQVLFRLGASALILLAGALLWELLRKFVSERSRSAVADLEGYRRGVPALVYFSSPHCVPCRAVQRPAVERVRASLGDQLQIVEVNTLERPSVAERWGVFSLPTTVLVDAGGRPRAVNSGITSFDALSAQIGTILLSRKRRRQAERAALDAEARKAAEGRFVELAGGFVHYREQGPADGRVVVLIHGFSVPSYVWDKTVGPLSVAGFRTIRYDLYGRGWSDRPKARYDRALFVRQLKELIDALGLRLPVSLVGVSMGGAIAAAFAADFPEYVDRAAFIAPVWEPLSKGFYTSDIADRLADDFYRPERFPDWEDRFRVQAAYRGFSDALRSTVRHFLSRDPRPDYLSAAAARIPIAHLWGREDRVLRTEGAAALRDALGSDPIWVEQAGHLPQYERPESVNPVLVEFLSRVI